MALPQVITLWLYGFVDLQRLLLGLSASFVVFAGMPVGAFLARRFGDRIFDRVILALLAAISVRLIHGALT